jgi:glutamate N-acetyltransferase/amino-acid N-acetyltransferase
LTASDVASQAVVGATFTQNKMLAAPVVYSKAVYRERETIRGVLINSGQANAATGQTGWTDAMIIAAAAASELGIDPNNLMLASTGVIGKRIKMVRH